MEGDDDDRAQVKDVCRPVVDIIGRAHLRLAERYDMLVFQFGRQSFPIAIAAVLNSLKTHLHLASLHRL